MWVKGISFLRSAVLVLTIGIAAAPVMSNVGQSVESSLFPVITNFTITKVDSVKDGIAINGYYDRKRLCPIEQIIWSSKINGNETEIPRAEPYKQKLRLGISMFHDFKLFISKEYLSHAVTGTAYYNCHPFWMSKTVFYDSTYKLKDW